MIRKLINFLRDIGSKFSVNKMLALESIKQRLSREQNLSFLEFNYSILQAFDFLELFENYNCLIQFGGSDQWGNIVSGIDLIRRLKNKNKVSSIHALLRDTFSLAKGLSFVLATFLSNCRSQISLAIHPAPLTSNPPKIINPKMNREGGAEGVNQRDQPAGIRSISLPLGLFHLRS